MPAHPVEGRLTHDDETDPSAPIGRFRVGSGHADSSSALWAFADGSALDDFRYCRPWDADVAAEAYKTNSALADGQGFHHPTGPRAGQRPASTAKLKGALGEIRTPAHGSGNQCSIP
jgi:hypothetical protein